MDKSIPQTNLVLVVDDDPVGRALVAALLKGQGCQVLQASDGRSGLEMARQRHPDLILLDVVMPGMDGYEVCEQVRASDGISDVPILMITTLEDHSSRIRGLEAGADDFLSKPIDSTELRARVRTILRLNRHRRAARLAELLSDAYDATLEGWVRALDLRDHETEGHTLRVTNMTVTLARAVGIADELIEHVRRGALLHDIGKIGVPDRVLLKPGPLDADERAIIERHPGFAHQMISPIVFLRPALDIPWCHHEKWDGTGYPRHLAGADIPLAARVFSVIDVWDAMRSNRPYHRSRPVDVVREVIAQGRGTHFDPAIAEMFLDLEAAGTFDTTSDVPVAAAVSDLDVPIVPLPAAMPG